MSLGGVIFLAVILGGVGILMYLLNNDQSGAVSCCGCGECIHTGECVLIKNRQKAKKAAEKRKKEQEDS